MWWLSAIFNSHVAGEGKTRTSIFNPSPLFPCPQVQCWYELFMYKS